MPPVCVADSAAHQSLPPFSLPPVFILSLLPSLPSLLPLASFPPSLSLPPPMYCLLLSTCDWRHVHMYTTCTSHAHHIVHMCICITCWECVYKYMCIPHVHHMHTTLYTCVYVSHVGSVCTSTCVSSYLHVSTHRPSSQGRASQVSCAQCVGRYGFGLFTCACVWVYGFLLSSNSF